MGPKTPTPTAWIGERGLLGDEHNDTEAHGGEDQAVCLYSLERIAALQDEGHPIGVGTTGENLTVAGLDWEKIKPGVQLSIGFVVVLEVTSYAYPCKTIKGSFVDGKMSRISQKKNKGWSRVYAKVLTPGTVEEGDGVDVSDGT
jgi:MOSC domain-containing protein YiiM